ncbi:Dicer-like protein 1, partial [Dissostichus eleginoides]
SGAGGGGGGLKEEEGCRTRSLAVPDAGPGSGSCSLSSPSSACLLTWLALLQVKGDPITPWCVSLLPLFFLPPFLLPSWPA